MPSTLLAISLLAGFLTTLSALTAVPAYATASYVQSQTYDNTGSSTTIVATFSSTTTVGDLIVAAYTFDDASGTTTTCTDSSGNSYATPIVRDDAGEGQATGICYANVTTAGTSTVTVHLPASLGYRDLSINEYSGVATSNPKDLSATNVAPATASVTDSVTSTAATTTVNNV